MRNDIIELWISPYSESKYEAYKAISEYVHRQAQKVAYSYDDGEDISQDALVRIMRQLKIDENSTVGSVCKFINMAVYCSYVDYYRKESKHNVGDSGIDVADNSRSIEDDIDLNKLIARVEKSVSDMTPRLQQVYNMYVLGELTSHEIANRLGVTDSTIRSTIQTLRGKLHEIQI